MNTTSTPLRSVYADHPKMKEIVAKFVGTLPRRMAMLHDLLQRQELDELQRAIHQLKGAGGGYGLMPITTQAAATEEVLKVRASAEAVQAAVESFITLVRSVDGYDQAGETTGV